MPEGKIQPDFPHVSVLNAAGVNTFKQLSKFSTDYTQITGIGPKFAEEISAAVVALDAPPPTAISEAAKPPVEPVSEPVPELGSVEPEPTPASVELGTPCRYQTDRDTIVDGLVYGVDPESGVAERVDAVINGRFQTLRGVRAASVLKAGFNDGVGCYCVVDAAAEQAGAGV